MKIGIGIDTGGTCTDAVALDLSTKTLLAKGKTETTREDLSIGIGKALDQLPQDLIKNASIVALSTTLATNACIEGKGCRAKLVLFGLPEEYLIRMHAPENYNLKKETVLCVDTHGSADGLRIDEPDWDRLFEENGAWLKDSDALCTVEIWSDDTGAKCEKTFKALAEEKTGRKCVAANEFTRGINIFARGGTALLNARLFPIVKEFIAAAEKDFRSRGCTAPIMVIRSDGSIMSSELTLSRPVETILSGPAASVLAGKNFTDNENYIIVDMGGTSTDVSVVKGGKPVTADEGIQIGEWSTSVLGIKVEPFNLGGDSAVRLENGSPKLFPRRVRSICSAALAWPEIKDELRALLKSNHYNNFPLHEFFYLMKEPEDISIYNTNERILIDAVRKGPMMLERLEAKTGIDIYALDSERLESEGIIMRIGLTPTDFMHIKKDYLAYDREASMLAVRYILKSLKRFDTEEEAVKFADEVYTLVEQKMFEDVVMICLKQQYPGMFDKGFDPQVKFLISSAWEHRNDSEESIIRQIFKTDYTLIGIGAPTHLFLPEAAKAMGGKYLLPENAEVANAMGALFADMDVKIVVNITERWVHEVGRFRYIVHAPSGSVIFDDRNEALEYAKQEGIKAAQQEAILRGTSENSEIVCHAETRKFSGQGGTKLNMDLRMICESRVKR